MSLISQRDREVAIRALEMYASEAETTEYYLGTPRHSSSEIHALLNWIRLEHFKHEN
jgi:putative alpha-1,2-mannosidase